MARELSARELPQRLIVRDPARAPQLPDAEVATASYEDPEAIHAETLVEARESRAGHPDWLVDGWIGSHQMLDTGEGSVSSHTIEHLTGHRPMTLAEFLAAEPASFAHLLG